ncbi:hypothetical protein L484_007258 [Morus notabilis]|uniref:Uncharacterized protein n=1 Tax=Morus notabilis TaxID=981085 RepID=W9RKC8_9ROSA|nr:hypothetical protein L484_007258 [Morus notabilis]
MRANQRSQEGQNPAVGGTQPNPPNGNQVETLTVVVERMATAITGCDQRPNSTSSLEDASMIPVNATAGNQINGDHRGDAEGVGDIRANLNPRPAKSNKSV